ncbi:MAG: hypothetical protein OK442_01005 [Thaumarchaeota archaeon]|nr:hypothetical protein [Nitrososphaerota archaeon]
MVAFISFLLTRAVKTKNGIDTAIIILFLGMMVAMLLGPAYLYLTTLGFGISDVVIWEIAVFMTLGMMPAAGLTAAKLVLLGEPGRTGPGPLSGLVSHTSELRAAYIFLLVLSEFLMGWTFNLASGLISLSAGYSLVDVAKQFEYSPTSYWFVFTMVGEMGFTLIALRHVIRPGLLKILAIQGVVMFLTPTALSSRVWETYTVYLEAAVMTGLVVFAMDYLRKRKERDRPMLSYLGLFIIANAVMMVGFLLWLVDGDSLLLAVSLIVETAIYFDAVFTGAGLGETFHG